ncbi:MAG: DnaJ domain-containing protein [Clostridia bacterium]|nr:DnaJ domain-containing protein [Clostridia bacterium]
MNQNPYDVLGIPSSATDDEVKKAYRRLAKQYHPDIHPDRDYAEKKMAEINAAYDEILSIRQGKATGGYGGYGNYSGYGQQSRQGSTPEMTAVRNYLHYRRFQEAFNVLNRITERNGEWYFLSAYAHYGVGNRTQALEFARRAVELEPNNMEYRQFLQQLQMGGMVYETYGRGFPMAGGNMMNKLCLGLCLARLCCPYC